LWNEAWADWAFPATVVSEFHFKHGRRGRAGIFSGRAKYLGGKEFEIHDTRQMNVTTKIELLKVSILSICLSLLRSS